jgi:hypothetical protein
MGFDPWNCSLKIWESIEIPTSKVGAHLGVWGFIPSHSLAFMGAWNVTPGLQTWPAPSQPFALVGSLRLGLRHLYPNVHTYILWYILLYKIVSSYRMVLSKLRYTSYLYHINMQKKFLYPRLGSWLYILAICGSFGKWTIFFPRVNWWLA